MEHTRRPEKAQGDLGDGRMGARSTQQAEPFALAAPLHAKADPFADLLDLSFYPVEKQPSETAAAVANIKPAVANVIKPIAGGRDSAGPQPPSGRNPAVSSEEGASLGMDPLGGTDGSLAAKKRKSQESRQKRDQFLDQMSSFLEGIESSTADVIPFEPLASFSSAEGCAPVASPSAQLSPPLEEWTGAKNVESKQPLWANALEGGPPPSSGNMFPDSRDEHFPKPRATGLRSSLMQEDPFVEDPFVAKELPTQVARREEGLRGVGGARSSSHPRGSLFDDDDFDREDTGLEDGAENQHPESPTGSASEGYPPKRVAPNPLPFSVPPHDTRGSQPKVRSKAKKRPTRGLDLEEVRRRTSLLSGEARTSPPPARAPTPPPAVAPRPADASSHYDSGWRRQQTLVSPRTPSEVPHPLLHTAAADPLSFGGGSGGSFDNRGNYFNEDLLLARAQGSKTTKSAPVEEGSTGRGAGQGVWGGDALKDSAGSFLNTARDGARTILQDAKTGVGAMGASVGWQGARDGSARTSERNDGQSRGLRPEDIEAGREFEVTFGEGRLGFTLFREDAGPMKGKGVVCKVHTGSTAHSLGVQLGDTVTGVNKRRYNTYDEVMEVLPKLPRPVLISFTRGRTGQSIRSEGGAAASARGASLPSEDAQGGGGNPLEWLAKLNPFDKRRHDEEDELRGNNSTEANADGKMASSVEYGLPGEVFANGLGGGVFSWSYYGTSDGIEANTRDTYTEHVMKCRWGRTADSMQSWMVARRYREFDALDLDLRDAYPDRRDALPRLPPKEFFKMAPDVIERRTKGLEMYMTTLIRRFPDLLESPHLDRFLTISERISTMQASGAARNNGQAVSHRPLGTYGASSNVFPTSEPSMDANSARTPSSALVGTDYILNPMSSEEAYRLSQARHSDPVDVAVAEDLIGELEQHLSTISPTEHLLSDAKLYSLVERCQQCWPRIKAAAAAAVSVESSSGTSETLLLRIVQCDEGMERAFDHLRAALASRGYIEGSP